MIEYRECGLCGRNNAVHRHHLIEGTANRKNSERYGLTMNLCLDCHKKAHEDPTTQKRLHRYAQKRFMLERGATVQDFIDVFGHNFLDRDEIIGGQDESSF